MDSSQYIDLTCAAGRWRRQSRQLVAAACAPERAYRRRPQHRCIRCWRKPVRIGRALRRSGQYRTPGRLRLAGSARELCSERRLEGATGRQQCVRPPVRNGTLVRPTGPQLSVDLALPAGAISAANKNTAQPPDGGRRCPESACTTRTRGSCAPSTHSWRLLATYCYPLQACRQHWPRAG